MNTVTNKGTQGLKWFKDSCLLGCRTHCLWLWLHTMHSVFEYDSKRK